MHHIEPIQQGPAFFHLSGKVVPFGVMSKDIVAIRGKKEAGWISQRAVGWAFNDLGQL